MALKGCCGCFDLQQGVFIITLLDIILRVFHIIRIDYKYGDNPLMDLAVSCISIIFNIISFIGVGSKNVGCITAYFAYKIFLFLVELAKIVYATFGLGINFGTFYIVFFLIFLVELYFIIVIGEFRSQLKKELKEVVDNRVAATTDKVASATINNAAEKV